MPTAAATARARTEPSEISTTRVLRRFRRGGGAPFGAPSEDPPELPAEAAAWLATFTSDVSDI
jgi:hypothetical protein